jgi:UDPglucose--hexose-1-phosphate uridylyltransferase
VPELRHDAITGRDVIVAVERAARPHTIEAPPDTGDTRDCPFCEGREHMTPPEVHRTGEGPAETTGWRVRVVPNLYPIVDAPTTHDEREGSVRVTGAHEVVILSPDHDASFAKLDPDQCVEVLTVVQHRVQHHLAAGHRYVQVFVNQGKAAGASIAHPHAQIVALDRVPETVAAAVDRFATTDLVAHELADARRHGRIVVDGPAPAWAPYAAWAPYGMRVAHRSTRARIEDASDAEIGVVAVGLRDALDALRRTLGEAPYNVVFRSAPTGTAAGEFHWHADVIPRISIVAGFEEGTGLYVNTVAPEQAAVLLRGGEPVGA